MTGPGTRSGLGLLTGLLGLVAMVRLVAGAFSGGMSQFAWVVTLVAMVPWVGYLTWRARRARLSPRAVLTVVMLDLVGLAVVWLLVVGPVLALGLSLVAFAVLWLADRPLREPRGSERYVRVEELRDPDQEDRFEEQVDPDQDQPGAGAPPPGPRQR